MVTMMMPQHQNHGNPPANSAAVGSIRSPQNHRLTSPSPLFLDAPCRVRLADILPYDGAPMAPYLRAVDALSASLMRHNAAVIELGSDDAALLRCALESARLYFRTRKGGRGVYTYRAGRFLFFLKKIFLFFFAYFDLLLLFIYYYWKYSRTNRGNSV